MAAILQGLEVEGCAAAALTVGPCTATLLQQASGQASHQLHGLQVMGLVELEPLRSVVIGMQGAGLSIEARKRTSIAVELVANPGQLPHFLRGTPKLNLC